jgi:hypothetical protein
MLAAPKFSLTIIYESMEAGKRAKRLSDQLIVQAAAERAFELNLWNFDVLGIPEVRNAAASAAAIADIVILSMSGTIPLPERTVEWVEMWTWLIDGRRPAVVALFAAHNPRCAAIQTYLRRSAYSKKLDFFPIMNIAATDPQLDEGIFNGQRQDADRAGLGSRWDTSALLSLSRAHSRLNRAVSQPSLNNRSYER